MSPSPHDRDLLLALARPGAELQHVHPGLGFVAAVGLPALMALAAPVDALDHRPPPDPGKSRADLVRMAAAKVRDAAALKGDISIELARGHFQKVATSSRDTS